MFATQNRNQNELCYDLPSIYIIDVLIIINIPIGIFTGKLKRDVVKCDVKNGNLTKYF